MLWWGGEFDAAPGEYLTHPSLAHTYGLAVENAHLPYVSANELWTGGSYETLLLDGFAAAPRMACRCLWRMFRRGKSAGADTAGALMRYCVQRSCVTPERASGA